MNIHHIIELRVGEITYGRLVNVINRATSIENVELGMFAQVAYEKVIEMDTGKLFTLRACRVVPVSEGHTIVMVDDPKDLVEDYERQLVQLELYCPSCKERHIDKDHWALNPHKTHRCEKCGNEWRPYPYKTVGA